MAYVHHHRPVSNQSTRMSRTFLYGSSYIPKRGPFVQWQRSSSSTPELVRLGETSVSQRGPSLRACLSSRLKAPLHLGRPPNLSLRVYLMMHMMFIYVRDLIKLIRRLPSRASERVSCGSCSVRTEFMIMHAPLPGWLHRIH
jgi:hypothetical protein